MSIAAAVNEKAVGIVTSGNSTGKASTRCARKCWASWRAALCPLPLASESKAR